MPTSRKYRFSCSEAAVTSLFLMQAFPAWCFISHLRGIEHRPDGTFVAAAGEDWDQFVSTAVQANCGGIECLAGIPGSVGGTPVQNVGAYGQEVSQTIVSVRALDLRSNEFVDLPAELCGFAYRRSIFNSTQRGKYIVSGVTYRLINNAESAISYADLKRYFQEWERAAQPCRGSGCRARDSARQGDAFGRR